MLTGKEEGNRIYIGRKFGGEDKTSLSQGDEWEREEGRAFIEKKIEENGYGRDMKKDKVMRRQEG